MGKAASERLLKPVDGIKLGSEYSDLAYNRKILPGEFLELEISNSLDDSTFAQLNVKVYLPTDLIKEKSLLNKNKRLYFGS